jgi:hypothetical protein
MTIAFCLHQSIQACNASLLAKWRLVAQQSDLISLGSDLGEEARNERRQVEIVDDTQGMEVGETGRSPS